jgi:glycosyltransferase involved in cell wall biosynthesis
LDNKTIINIGRLTSDKRQDLLLKIWSAVSVKHSDWKLKIVGRGELKRELIQIINDYGLMNSVEIIEPIKDVESLFLSSSIFAFTSKHEGFGMVLAEAMACGVPCISFDIPSGPSDIIENDIDGFLIKNNDILNYIETLDFLMSDTDKRAIMGKKAQESVKKFLDYKIEKKWNDLFDHGEV